MASFVGPGESGHLGGDEAAGGEVRGGEHPSPSSCLTVPNLAIVHQPLQCPLRHNHQPRERENMNQ